MTDDITVTATKKTPPTSDLTVYINGKILNRFEGFTISHSVDSVPMTFSLRYGFSEGESETDALNIKNITKSGKEAQSKLSKKTSAKGLLTVGSSIEIYLEKKKVLTGYIENTDEGYSYGEHSLTCEGRSKTSVIVDSTTDINQSGMLPDTLVTLSDIAGYMFSGFNISTLDKTTSPAKYPLVGYSAVNLTTKPYDYVANLCQYEGKLLYDNEFGQMVIDEVPSKAVKSDSSDNTTTSGNTNTSDGKNTSDNKATDNSKITDKNSKFESINCFKTTYGRYRSYRVVINAYGGPAGIDQSLITVPEVSDPYPNELPPGKNLTIVSDAAYPTDGNTSGLIQFQKTLAQYMANNNWGRGQTISVTATGFKNPITNELWKINTLYKFDYKNPYIKGDFVVQSLTFSVDMYGGRKTDLVFIRREALLPEPITIAPPILGVNQPTNEDKSNSSKTKDQKLNVPDTPPDNAKPVETKSTKT